MSENLCNFLTLMITDTLADCAHCNPFHRKLHVRHVSAVDVKYVARFAVPSDFLLRGSESFLRFVLLTLRSNCVVNHMN